MSLKDNANKAVDEFMALKECPSMWTNLDRSTIGAGLKVRIDDPDKINQADTSLCGPAEFIRDIAEDRPDVYAKAAIDLYKTGRANIDTFSIKPGSDLKKYALPSHAGGIHQADWILLASIRDTDNWFFDYQQKNDDMSAITMPHSKETWLKKAGFTDIVNETNVLFCKDIPCASKASALFSKGYKVALFINSNMLDAGKMNSPSVTPDHWVALTSPILINSFNLQHPGAVNEDPASRIELEVYSWGARHKIPKSGRLTDYNFSINFYGFIACRR